MFTRGSYCSFAGVQSGPTGTFGKSVPRTKPRTQVIRCWKAMSGWMPPGMTEGHSSCRCCLPISKGHLIFPMFQSGTMCFRQARPTRLLKAYSRRKHQGQSAVISRTSRTAGINCSSHRYLHLEGVVERPAGASTIRHTVYTTPVFNNNHYSTWLIHTREWTMNIVQRLD